MNWRQGRAYGQDQRDKMFVAIDTLTRNAAATAPAAMPASSGETAARPQCCHVPGKLDAYHADIRAQVAAKPDITIGELRRWMRDTHGVSVSHAVMWEKLQEL
jgi:hypothetical protein